MMPHPNGSEATSILLTSRLVIIDMVWMSIRLDRHLQVQSRYAHLVAEEYDSCVYARIEWYDLLLLKIIQFYGQRLEEN